VLPSIHINIILICIHKFLCIVTFHFQGLLLDVLEDVDSLLLDVPTEERLETRELIRPRMRQKIFHIIAMFTVCMCVQRSHSFILTAVFLFQ
jgi:hypothetical protein